jgi:autotransporter-associated beta strand protein
MQNPQKKYRLSRFEKWLARNPALLAACAGVGVVPSAMATTYTWDGGLSHGNSADNNWSTTNNWKTGIPASSIDTDIDFSLSGSRKTANQNIATPFLLHSISFDSTSNVTAISGSSLEFITNSGTIAPVLTQSSATAVTISNALTFTTNVTSSGSGNLSLIGPINGTGALTQAGTGATTLAGTSSYTGHTTINVGALTIANGASVTNSLISVNGGGTLYMTGGAVNTGAASFFQLGNVAGGTAAFASLSGGSVTSVETDVANAANTFAIFNQSGGTHTDMGGLYLSVNSGTNANYNLSGTGSLSAATINIGDRGTGTFTQTGGVATVGSEMKFGLVDNSNGTFNLDGGTLITPMIDKAGGNGHFNFDGGTLQAANSNSAFFQGITDANVQTLGAIVSTSGFNITIVQPLLHDAALGANIDGGLTKIGAGTLTLNGTSTYTGPTTVNNGMLTLGTGLLASTQLTVNAGGAYNLGSNGTLGGTVNDNSGIIEFQNNGLLAGAGTSTIASTYTSGDDLNAPGILKSVAGSLTNANVHTVLLGTAAAGGAGTISAFSNLDNEGVIDTTEGTGSAIISGATITNNGTIRASGSFLYLDAPTIVNNGLVQSTGSAANIYLNDQNNPNATITGSGNWDIESALTIEHPVNFTTTGSFVTAVDSVVIINGGSTSSSISVGNLSGGAAISTSGGSASPVATIAITNGDPTQPFTGNITGNINFVKTGSGTQVFTGNQNYSGTTTISGGTLQVDGQSTATGSGNVEVQNNGTISGTGFLPAFVTIDGGGAIAPGDNAPGTISPFQLRLLSGSRINLDLASSGTSAFINDNGSGIDPGGSTVTIADWGLVPSATPIWFMSFVNTIVIDGNGIPDGQQVLPSDFTLAPGPVNGFFIVDQVDSEVGFVVTSVNPLTWNNLGASGDGATWDIGVNQNWSNGTHTAFHPSNNVIFSDNNNGHNNVTLNSIVTPGSVTFVNNSVNYTISGTGGIGGSGGLLMLGSGTVTLNTSNSYSGPTNISSGTFIFGAKGGVPANNAVTVGNGSNAAILRLKQNTGTTTLSSLSVNTNGTLDLTNNTLRINFTSPAADPVSTITNYLTTGYNGGLWTGAGIDSSTAAAGSAGLTLSVGYADGNADVGTPAAANQIVVKYTLAGDANLDGLVNFQDLVTVVQNFNKPGTDWARGNFLFGASTNFQDLVAVVQNFNKILNPGGSSGHALGGSAIQLTDVQLPEPDAISLAIGAAALMTRRRRRI